jgi:L,D-transpeptidase catalytic domain
MARTLALRFGLATVVAVGTAGFGFVGPASAAAGSTSGTTSAPSTTTTSTPPASAPAPSGSLSLYFRGVFGMGRQQVTVPHRVLQVEASEYPYVPGQWVTMLVYLRGRLVHKYGLQVKPAGNGKSGHVSYATRSPGAGQLVVVVRHDATTALRAFSARHAVTVLDDRAGFGSRGPFIGLIQRRLASLHFYIPQTDVYDDGTGLALDAYHRLMGWGTSNSLDSRAVTALLNGDGRFPVRYSGDGRHAEANLSKQLLALVDRGHVVWIFPISSGKSSTPTILGRFHVYLKTPGYLPDGMYYSSFFSGGYAVHGYDPAPDFPDSHGCVRLPIADAIAAYNWLRMGDGVDVYY